jgi:DNA-binding transcriptional LysR family regulator
MAALIPRRLALIAAQGGRIRLIEPPYPSPAVEVTLLYVKDRLNEPAIAWMRDQIRTVAAKL